MILAAAGGCSETGARRPVVEVTGRVFLEDQPLEFGQVVFQPISGGQPAIGRLSPDGSFVLGTYEKADGAAVGRHQVRVVSYTAQAPDHVVESRTADSLGDLLTPERYASFATSGIEISVLEDGNAPFIIKLKSGNAPSVADQNKSDSMSGSGTPPASESIESDDQRSGTYRDIEDVETGNKEAAP